MLFLHPMWQHESQRLGKRSCTPVGYAMHAVAELIGFAGLLTLPVVPAILLYRWVAGTCHASSFRLLFIPFGLGVASEILMTCSWGLALRKQFSYDDERRESSWLEAGEIRTYKWRG